MVCTIPDIIYVRFCIIRGHNYPNQNGLLFKSRNVTGFHTVPRFVSIEPCGQLHLIRYLKKNKKLCSIQLASMTNLHYFPLTFQKVSEHHVLDRSVRPGSVQGDSDCRPT